MSNRPCTCSHWGGGPDWDCPTHGPCQGCHEVTGELMAHDGTCDGISDANVEQMRADYRARIARGES